RDHARRSDACRRPGGRLRAEEDREARARAADEHVPLRRGPAARDPRLAAGGARLRRAARADRGRDLDLAAAPEPEPDAPDPAVSAREPRGLRPPAAGPVLLELRGPREPLRAAAEL